MIALVALGESSPTKEKVAAEIVDYVVDELLSPPKDAFDEVMKPLFHFDLPGLPLAAPREPWLGDVKKDSSESGSVSEPPSKESDSDPLENSDSKEKKSSSVSGPPSPAGSAVGGEHPLLYQQPQVQHQAQKSGPALVPSMVSQRAAISFGNGFDGLEVWNNPAFEKKYLLIKKSIDKNLSGFSGSYCQAMAFATTVERVSGFNIEDEEIIGFAKKIRDASGDKMRNDLIRAFLEKHPISQPSQE